MKKKNQLPIKWMLGIIILLMAVVYGTHQASEDMALHPGSHISSPTNFFQFLANIFGFGSFNASPNGPYQKNNASNQNNPNFRLMGGVNAGNQQNPNSISAENESALQGRNAAQQKNSTGNNSELNAEYNPEITAENNSKNSPEMNAEYNSEFNAELNAENNPEDNPEMNAEYNAQLNAENNPESNSEINAENNAENNPGSNSEVNAENNPGSNPGDASGGNPGNNSGDNSGNNFGNNVETINPDTLPTINPIPSDDAVSQSIAKENQENNALAALVAARQALVVPVQQQAQASKFQTVASQNIPAASTTQPPPDVEAKIQAKQLTYH